MLYLLRMQVDRYLTAYAARGGLPTTELGHCRRLLATAREAYAAAQASLAGTAAEAPEITASGAQAKREAKQTAGFEALEAVAEAAYEGFLDAAGALARRKFTRFDLPLMAAGALLCMAACLGLHAWLLCRWGAGERAHRGTQSANGVGRALIRPAKFRYTVAGYGVPREAARPPPRPQCLRGSCHWWLWA